MENTQGETDFWRWRAVASAALLVSGIALIIGFSPVMSVLVAVHGWVAHQFFEVPQLAAIRQASQVVLLRYHLAFWMICSGLFFMVSGRLQFETRRFWQVLFAGWAIRAGCWIIGGNLPLVPGDSCHYIETANSVAMGLPSSKHYVESFFRDYPAIRAGRPVLDDWATPLYADLLGIVFRLAGAGIGPEKSLEFSFGLAKGLSFILNLMTLPCLYFYVRRCISKTAALPTMALAAILPVHAIYAGFELRESLVGLTSVVAVWLVHEMLLAGSARKRLLIAIPAGICAGLAILSRNTAMALVAWLGLWLLWQGRGRLVLPGILWGAVALAVITPWAWLTYQEYGKPFYSYTEHFAHTFSWTVHHYAAGVPDAKAFYSSANMPEVVRVKIKSMLIMAGYSTMILSPPIVFGFYLRLKKPANRSGRGSDLFAIGLFVVFGLATMARIADVTQVAQLGRYYLPVYLLMIPTAIRGFQEMQAGELFQRKELRRLAV
ncbi:MAG: ArnT family glycosyltransferase, partial [bacterium]